MSTIINKSNLQNNPKSIHCNSISTELSNKLSKIKLIVSDLDGTFLSSNGELSYQNIISVKSLYNKNINFTLASGRSDLMCASYIKDCNITLPIISSNGALIRNSINKNIVFKSIIQSSVALKIMNFCKENELDYMSYNLDKIFFTEKSLRIEKFKVYNKIAIKNHTDPIVLNFYDNKNNTHKNISDEGVLKILLFTKNKKDLNIATNFLNNIPEISFVLSEKNALDISPKGISKGEALQTLCSYLNIPLENTCVFGDYTNDISMMKLAGISFAMSNSPKYVQDIATFLTDSNDNSGVAKALEFILSNIK
ncbi:HAD family hydrolase [uncultured Clostridium sp.]|uniref:HAD family hydrolase n=1 Tax=uncultured Clostridium sp. TaxID=59620 RepID=UPI002593AE53|nr:HAD family hydrolase [uncultured Clostridium sp.]